MGNRCFTRSTYNAARTAPVTILGQACASRSTHRRKKRRPFRSRGRSPHAHDTRRCTAAGRVRGASAMLAAGLGRHAYSRPRALAQLRSGTRPGASALVYAMAVLARAIAGVASKLRIHLDLFRAQRCYRREVVFEVVARRAPWVLTIAATASSSGGAAAFQVAEDAQASRSPQVVRPTTREAPRKDRSARGASEGTRFVCRDPRRALFLSLTEPLPRCLIHCDNSGRAVPRSAWVPRKRNQPQHSGAERGHRVTPNGRGHA
jgi:hypothetical protein